MNKILAALLVALPLSALAAPATYSDTSDGVKGVCASGTCDAPVEAAGTTDGAPLTGGFITAPRGVYITVCADSGQTLSGAGTLTAYGRSTSVELWAALPEFNLVVSSSARRCQMFSAIQVVIPNGRITWVPTGVTVSGGGVTVYITTR